MELGFTNKLLLENEIATKRIKELEGENRKLKSEIENMKKVGRENIETLDKMSIELENYSESFKRYRDFEKQELADSLYDMEEENRKLKAHCNMLESENRLLKEECKARLEKIKELETDYDRLKVAFEDVVSGK